MVEKDPKKKDDEKKKEAKEEDKWPELCMEDADSFNRNIHSSYI